MLPVYCRKVKEREQTIKKIKTSEQQKDKTTVN